MIPLGNTQLPESIFLGFLQGINSKFTQETYDLFRNNCNNFTDECA
jgi:desumoylating isopeptidase 1